VADELDPKNPKQENEQMGSRTKEGEVSGRADEEDEFEDIDETDSDEEDLES
jgi:hypothetical protein